MTRTLLAVAIALAALPLLAQVRLLDLVPSGEPHNLPVRIQGIAAEPFWDDLIRDPAKIAVSKSLHPAFTRFPGGTQSNYYDWRRGMFYVPAAGGSTPFYRRFVNLSAYAQRQHPEGISFEQYKAFSDAIGAEVILVPNLETSPVEEQVAWFKHLASEGIVPAHIELGNEFWVAMGQDPAVLKRWPDALTSMQIMRRYIEALRPYLPKGAKVAVQAAAPSFRGGGPRLVARLSQWNRDLHAEPWFDAVTIHMYPRLNELLGPGAASDEMTPAIAMRNLKALMAHIDDAGEKEVRDVAERLPGKEIWITEWNPRGGVPAGSPDDRAEPTTPAMQAHLVTRMGLMLLRHPRVTLSEFFTIRFGGQRSMFVQTAQGYQPALIGVALRWLDEAANGGVAFQRYTEAGNPRVSGGGSLRESYGAVEAGLFRAEGRATMILQNVSADRRTWKMPASLKLGVPSRVERLVMPDMADMTLRPGASETVSPAVEIPVPPYSVTRIIWSTH